MDEQAKQFELLISALNSEDENRRYRACIDLEWLGDLRAVEPLIARLQDTEAFVRAAAAKALGRLGDKRAIMPLRALLTDHALINEVIPDSIFDGSEVRDRVENVLDSIGGLPEIIDEPVEMLWRE